MKYLAIALLICTSAHAQVLSIDDSMAKPETKAAFKAFRPGPNVKAALDGLEQEGRDLLARMRDGQADERTVIRERARRELAAFVIKAWAFTHKRDEVARVAVIILGSSEFYQIFPRGIAHLPKQLTPKSIYPSAPGEQTMWQYVGQRDVAGSRFVVFRKLGANESL